MYILLLEVEKPLFSFSYFVTDPLTFFFLFFKEYSRRCLEMHLFRVIIQCWLNLSTCQLSNHKSNTLLFGKVYSDARLHYHMTGVWQGRAMIMSALEGKWLLNVQYSLKRGGGVTVSNNFERLCSFLILSWSSNVPGILKKKKNRGYFIFIFRTQTLKLKHRASLFFMVKRDGKMKKNWLSFHFLFGRSKQQNYRQLKCKKDPLFFTLWDQMWKFPSLSPSSNVFCYE